jgi:hypothetical protein
VRGKGRGTGERGKGQGVSTANNFEFMYSRQRISKNSFPKFTDIFPKSFMIFQQECMKKKFKKSPKKYYKKRYSSKNC